MSLSLMAQCEFIIPSSNGYTVRISLSPSNVLAPTNCPFGFNFKVEIDYEIQFTGLTSPGSLYTLQGRLDCEENKNIFFPLPNNPTIGTTTTSNKYRNDPICATATPLSMNCLDIELQIHGPGIPNQRIDCSVALPVELLSFSAKEQENQVFLYWQTASETNNDFFSIERSKDLKSWEQVQEVAGIGNSTQTQSYQAIDPQPYAGTSYYRLKQTDFDGTISYSSAIAILIENVSSIKPIIYSDSGEKFLRLDKSNFAGQSLELFNALGQEMTNYLLIQETESYIELNLSLIPPGIYFLKGFRDVVKFVK